MEGVKRPRLATKFCKVHSKQAHPSMRQAIKVALWNSVDYGTGMHVYKCSCKLGYHLTSMEQS